MHMHVSPVKTSTKRVRVNVSVCVCIDGCVSVCIRVYSCMFRCENRRTQHSTFSRFRLQSRQNSRDFSEAKVCSSNQKIIDILSAEKYYWREKIAEILRRADV